MPESQFPRLREHERLVAQVNDLENKVESALYDSDDGIQPRLIRLEETLQKHIADNNRNLKLVGTILVALAGALGGAMPKILEAIVSSF